MVDARRQKTCKNLVWHEMGAYYCCSLPEHHRVACVADPAHIAHDDAVLRDRHLFERLSK